MNTDITALKSTEAELAHQALHDPLTGLANRALLLDQLTRILARRQRAPALGRAAVPRPRPVQGRQRLARPHRRRPAARGHRRAAERRPSARPTPWPGSAATSSSCCIEDFIDPRDPITLAERIQRVLKEPVVVDGNEVFTTVSIGIAVANSADDTADGLLRDADAAMYLAKARGRDRYEIFDEELRTPGHRAPPDRVAPAPGGRDGRDRGLLPARAVARHRRDGRRRGAGPVAPPGGRVCSRPAPSSSWPRTRVSSSTSASGC